MVWQLQAVMNTLLSCYIVKFMSPKSDKMKMLHTVIDVVNHFGLFYILKNILGDIFMRVILQL